MPASRVRLADLSLRSLGKLEPPSLASWGELAPTLEALDRAGFATIEAWGDLTFDRCLGSIQESPWERLSRLAAHVTRTPLQMEIRGRCLLGSRPYSSEVIRAFIAQAVECGIRSFLVYEPLNDIVGLEMVATAVRESGARLTLGIVSAGGNTSAGGLDLPVADRLAGLQPDAVCLKTAEAMAPKKLRDVVGRLVSAVSVPVEVNLDNAGCLGAAGALASVEAGAVVVYGSSAPAWMDPSSVPYSALIPLLADGGWGPEVDGEAAAVAGTALAVTSHAGEVLSSVPSSMHDSSLIDWRHLMRVPADVVWQVGERLRSLEATRRLPDVVTEIERVRTEVGTPVLVAPVAQIIATQAVLNVVYEKRWQIVPDEMKAYLRGDYGDPPGPVAAELARLGERELDARESAPTLDELASEIRGLALTAGDVLMHALAPASAAAFLESRRAAMEVETLFDPVEMPDAMAALQSRWRDLSPERVRDLVSLLEESSVDELTIEDQGTRISLRKAGPPQSVIATSDAHTTHLPEGGGSVGASVADESQVIVAASMVGTFYGSPAPGVPPYVEVGSHVIKGEPLCVLEAMKLMNEQLSEVSGEIVAVLVEDGAAVEYGQPLFVVQIDSE